jgi:hypothetical protein
VKAGGTVPRVPNKRAPGVSLHSFAVPDELWARVLAAAEYNGDQRRISEIVVRKALLAYAKRTETKMEAERKMASDQ